MKLIASLIVCASLVLGVIAASTAYVVSLDLTDAQLLEQELTLNAPYGVIPINEANNQLIGRSAMRLRQLDNYNAEVAAAIKQVLDEGFSKDELGDPPPPPADTFRATLVAQDRGLDLAIYDALVAAGIRPETLRIEQQTDLVESRPLAPVPIWKKNTVLDEDTLAAMRSYSRAHAHQEWYRDVITVKQFAFGRWQHRWWFLLAVVGLTVGSLGVRRAGRAAVAKATSDTSTTASNPRASLDAATAALVSLRDQIAQSTDASDASHQIIESIDRIQAEYFEPFIAARPQLIGSLGMGGYARLMDAFASAERQLNRAWSAAADHVLEEAESCLAEGITRLETTSKLLAG